MPATGPWTSDLSQVQRGTLGLQARGQVLILGGKKNVVNEIIRVPRAMYGG